VPVFRSLCKRANQHLLDGILRIVPVAQPAACKMHKVVLKALDRPLELGFGLRPGSVETGGLIFFREHSHQFAAFLLP
jgi:hypothetical protein